MLGGIRRLAVGALCAPCLALAQAGDPGTRERIEVTGSHIPRVEGETALPVQVITREDIEKGGIQTTQDLLDRVSAHLSYGGWTEAQGVGNSLANFTGVSLRGLGVERTLVLLNGRRLAPYALSKGAAVDVSGIPVGAIERVEVLKDGASAIYGTDAIGGVVNFILRKGWRGTEAYANYFAPEDGGGESARASAAFGYGELARDGYTFMLSADAFWQKSLAARDREFSRTGYLPGYGYDATSLTAWPGNIGQPRIINPDTGAVIRPGGFTGLRNPTIPFTGATANSCLPPLSFPTIGTPAACRFDFAAVIDIIPDSSKANLIGRAAWKVGDAEAFAEATYYRGTIESRISPTPAAGGPPIEIQPGSPTYPTAFVASLPGGRTDLPVRLNYRLVEFGPRVTETDSEQWRGVLGIRGTRWDWDYEAAVNYNANRQVQSFPSGWFSTRGFVPLVTSGVVNPFAPNTPEAIERVRATQITGEITDNRASHVEADLRASGSPWALGAGPIAVAAGLAARREWLEQSNAPVLYSGDILSFGTPEQSLEGVSRTVWALYAEAAVPLHKTVEATFALRTDHYSDFGTTTNPKVSLRWQPSPAFLVRANWGKGFRAPTLADLHTPLAPTGVGPYDDPLRCPSTGFETDCDAEFPARIGGNPDLKPEKSTQANLGFVLEPVAGLSVAVDYYRVEIRNLITAIPDSSIFSDYAQWGSSLVVRHPPNAATPGLPGRIDHVLLWDVNAGDLRTSGFDLDARYRSRWSWGQLAVGVTGTYVDDYQVQQFESAVRGPGWGFTGAIPRWRHYASIDATSGAWGATLAQNFQSHYTTLNLTTCPGFQPGPDCTGTRKVGTLEVYDLQGRYTGWRNLALTAGVRNLFDRAPPRALTPQTFQIGYDVTYADPRGRTYYIAARYAFR